MGVTSAVRRGSGLVLLVLLAPFVAALVPSAAPSQDYVRTCLVCHDDTEITSSAGTSVHVSSTAFAASVHGQAGIGCTGCHNDLQGVKDFPHSRDLKAVTCTRCHTRYDRDSLAGVHATPSPRLAAKPVLCKDCHGYHDVRPSSDPRSAVHSSNRPATCARCHPGAGMNYAKGLVHDPAAAARATPAGVVRVLYEVFIGIVTAFFFAYIVTDLIRRGRER